MMKNLSCIRFASLLIAGLLVVCCLTAFIGVRSSRTLFVPLASPLPNDPEALTLDHPELMSFEIVEGGLLLTARGSGRAELMYGGQPLILADCSEDGFVYDALSEQYTGAVWVQGAMLVFLSGAGVILLLALLRQLKRAFYHYATPLLTAFLLLDILVLAAVLLLLPSARSLENTLSLLPPLLLLFTLPILILFALAMLVSNLSLLRHEGRTWRNLLGSLIGLALSLAALLIVFNTNASGSLEQLHFHDFLVNLLSGLVLWTECKLAGIILCGVWAARRQPAMNKDYVLILGCQLSRKGGLTPLLRGRVDRALSFARQQQAASGRMPVLIPCGGKGRDELRSEASAMREYLLEQGVPEEGILAEDRSANTWENLRNAQSMMKPGARAAYATTNYHVFRAGVWASRNGLQAEGMGSKTKWYYWPNAFMREYVALIAANLPHEIAMIVLIGIQSGLLAYLYH